MLAVRIRFFERGFIFGKLIFSPPLFFFLASCNYSQCLWDFLFNCLYQVTQDVILDTNQKGENMTKYCLLQARVFPCRGLCSGCPPEPGQRLSSSCSKRHSARCQPQTRLLEALETKMKGENQLEFEEAALEVCNLHWRAQWRWQRVLLVSLSCVTGILWALLAARASQSLKNQNPASVTSWETLSGSCTSPHPNGSLPTGKSPLNHSLGKALVVLQGLRNSCLLLPYNTITTTQEWSHCSHRINSNNYNYFFLDFSVHI